MTIASGCESTRKQRTGQVGEQARDGPKIVSGFRMLRNGSKQLIRVRMHRRVSQSLGRPALDYLSGVHNGNAIAIRGSERKIVRNKQGGHRTPFRKITDQSHYRGLGCHVEPRGRFIRDQKFGFTTKSERDANTLALTARKFKRIMVRAAGIDADVFE
jgi:hypothetical protein